MSYLKTLIVVAVAFAILSISVLIDYELRSSHDVPLRMPNLNTMFRKSGVEVPVTSTNVEPITVPASKEVTDEKASIATSEIAKHHPTTVKSTINVPAMKLSDEKSEHVSIGNTSTHLSDDDIRIFEEGVTEKKGLLKCNGEYIDSEIIYWKRVKGDRHYESPITPHHDNHHDKYLTFEYDHGGWNNVRMALECVLVVAHATGRNLVIPPQQHLYLLGATHKDKHDKEAHDEMGFADFFDIDLLQSHLGFHMISMEQFLRMEAQTGGLHPEIMKLPNNDTTLSGPPLWSYINRVADVKPAWAGRFMIFPDHAGKLRNTTAIHHLHPEVVSRLKIFTGDRFQRQPIFYDELLQNAHHVHVPGHGEHRLLQHHYAFTFFEDKNMQSFYKRFVRDYVRYKDEIQCVGHELVKAVRADSLKLNPDKGGIYYALHIRRGDLQYKDVKISAKEIVKNLNITDDKGQLIIPPGSLVYISTDDPDGLCKGCTAKGKDCSQWTPPKPVGCPDDPSWNAMIEYGWHLRFLRDYQKRGMLKDVNPNTLGMIETIICSRAQTFAGTWFSTFTGYIHRLRGYHGLGDFTYYHHKDFVRIPKRRVGHGWWREWKAGWTDDAGELI